MTSETVQFVPRHRIAEFEAAGWVVSDDMRDCHHGAHSVLMRAPDTFIPLAVAARRALDTIKRRMEGESE